MGSCEQMGRQESEVCGLGHGVPEGERECMEEEGCKAAQGYVISGPVEADSRRGALRTRRGGGLKVILILEDGIYVIAWTTRLAE